MLKKMETGSYDRQMKRSAKDATKLENYHFNVAVKK